jgi:hypothetical protein
MDLFTSISAAIRTRHGRFSGTSARPWIVVNQSGVDLLNNAMLSTGTVGSVRRGESLYYYQPLPVERRGDLSDDRIGPADLYIRLSTTSSDLWEPELAIVWGSSKQHGAVPLALDMSLVQGLSCDPAEGVVSVPVRRVYAGTDDTLIHSLLLVLVTYDAPYAGTDDPISLRVMAPEGKAVDHIISDTPQTDLEIDTANIYEVPVDSPFSRGELRKSEAAEIKLSIHGSDKWVPKKIFLFGLDHPPERPEHVVLLSRMYDPGPLSADPSEGVPSLILPVE